VATAAAVVVVAAAAAAAAALGPPRTLQSLGCFSWVEVYLHL
jgi:hypothetical protein